MEVLGLVTVPQQFLQYGHVRLVDLIDYCYQVRSSKLLIFGHEILPFISSRILGGEQWRTPGIDQTCPIVSLKLFCLPLRSSIPSVRASFAICAFFFQVWSVLSRSAVVGPSFLASFIAVLLLVTLVNVSFLMSYLASFRECSSVLNESV